MGDVVDLLHDARMTIVERGWTRGVIFDPVNKPPVCAMVAKQIALNKRFSLFNHDADWFKVSHKADKILCEACLAIYPDIDRIHRFTFGGTVVHWNDHIANHKGEVLALYDKAIEIAEQRRI